LKAGNFPGYGFCAIPQQVIGRYLVVFGLAFPALRPKKIDRGESELGIVDIYASNK